MLQVFYRLIVCVCVFFVTMRNEMKTKLNNYGKTRTNICVALLKCSELQLSMDCSLLLPHFFRALKFSVLLFLFRQFNELQFQTLINTRSSCTYMHISQNINCMSSNSCFCCCVFAGVWAVISALSLCLSITAVLLAFSCGHCEFNRRCIFIFHFIHAVFIFGVWFQNGLEKYDRFRFIHAI